MCFVEFGGITIIGWQRERISCGPLYCCVQENSFDALKINYSLVQNPIFYKDILLLMPPPPTKKIRRGNECHNVCVATAGGTGGRRTSIPQKMLLDLHFILRLYLGQRNTKVYHRPFKWWSHSLGGPAPNFSTKIKIITQAKQNKWFPTYLLLLRDAKNVEECEESERCRQNTTKQPGALGQLWWPSPASGARHDMWWWCDNETSRWRRPGDRSPEVSIHCSHFHTSTSSPLYPSFSFPTPVLTKQRPVRRSHELSQLTVG